MDLVISIGQLSQTWLSMDERKYVLSIDFFQIRFYTRIHFFPLPQQKSFQMYIWWRNNAFIRSYSIHVTQTICQLVYYRIQTCI